MHVEGGGPILSWKGEGRFSGRQSCLWYQAITHGEIFVIHRGSRAFPIESLKVQMFVAFDLYKRLRFAPSYFSFKNISIQTIKRLSFSLKWPPHWKEEALERSSYRGRRAFGFVSPHPHLTLFLAPSPPPSLLSLISDSIFFHFRLHFHA